MAIIERSRLGEAAAPQVAQPSVKTAKIQSCVENALDYCFPRNEVHGRREFRIIPMSAEKWIGENVYDLYCGSTGGLTLFDRDRSATVDDIFQRIVTKCRRFSDLKDAFECRVIDSTQVNAWALPGGKIAIYKGLIEAIEAGIAQQIIAGYDDVSVEDVLAAVLSHEAAHTDARHSVVGIERTLLLQIALFIVYTILYLIISDRQANARSEREARSLEIVKKLLSGTKEVLSRVGIKLLDLARSRSQEFEADKYGMVYMKEAGFNPRGALWLQEFFQKRNPDPKLPVLEYFLTHPSSERRLEANKETLANLEKLCRPQGKV